MNPCAELIRMFEGVPLPSEVTSKVRGVEKPAVFDAVEESDAPDPLAWMKANGVRYEETVLGPLVVGEYSGGVVKINTLHEVKPKRVIYTLWHEIGHYLDDREPCYSVLHAGLLKQVASLVVSLRELSSDCAFQSDGDWTKYANQPEELWAEAVAIAVCKPDALRPTPLWPVLEAVLVEKRIITLPTPAAPVAVDTMTPTPLAVGTEVEGVGKPLPTYRFKELGELVEAGKFPQTIFTILAQIGGFNLNGALTAVGCCLEKIKQVRWRHPDKYYDGETRGKGARWVWSAAAPSLHPGGLSCKGPGHLDYDVGIDFPVNGAPGEWRMAVTYEPDDTYAVWLWCESGHLTGLLSSTGNVYCDELDEVIDRKYTTALKDFNEGAIPNA